MTKARLIAALLSMALTLAATTAVVAQDESPAPESPDQGFDTTGLEEWEEDEALLLYQWLENSLLAMGVAEEDLDDAITYLQGTWGSLSEAERNDLIEAWAAAGLFDELRTEEEGEAVDMGDEEFGQSEEEEPDVDVDIDIGDDEEEE